MAKNTYNDKRYFWLKLPRHFFRQARIKKLRKTTGSDTCVVIYLELLLLSIDRRGLLAFEKIENSMEEELALKIDEDVEKVKMTWSALLSMGLSQPQDDDEFLLVEALDMVGSETQSNIYKRASRIGKIPTTFQQHSNNIPTEIEKDSELDTNSKLDRKLEK